MLDTLGIFLLGFQIIILMYFLFTNLTYTIFTLISLKDIRTYSATVANQGIRNILAGIYYRPVSILVPAYNEQLTIEKSLKALLSLKYPEYEVVVVNDGSTDATMAVLTEKFGLVRLDRPFKRVLKHAPIRGIYGSVDNPNLIVIDKDNGGKSDALNAGLNVADFPIYCCIDADSLLEKDALVKASRLFMEDKEVIATGGIVRTLNGCKVSEDGIVTEINTPKKMIENFQAVEYTRGFLSGRTSWNSFQSLLIISGAFGVFRKDLVMEIGGYRTDTVGEDMDLVLRLHRHCCDKKIKYKVIFIPDPVCWTQVPNDLTSLLRQRNRWHRGLIESLIHSRKLFLNPRYGAVGLLGFPYFIIIEALGPVIEVTGYAGLVLFYLLGYLSRDFAILFFFLAILTGIWINLGSILLDNLIFKRYNGVKDIIKLSVYGMLEFFGYRQLIVMERFLATFQFWKKGWGKLRRHEI